MSQPAQTSRSVKKPSPKTALAKRGVEEAKYKVGDKVVHTQHGAATVIGLKTKSFKGPRQQYYILEMATEHLRINVPVAKQKEQIRDVISKTRAIRVISVLRKEPSGAGTNWSRWFKVLNEKMTSGIIDQVAEVVRDLSFAQQAKGISPALKRMLSKARNTLTSELQFSLGISAEEAAERIESALPPISKFLPGE